MRISSTPLRTLLATLVMAAMSHSAQATDLTFTLSNTGGAGGVGLAPLWLGLQGNADAALFSVGGTASAGLEQAAEDGSAAGLASEFALAHAAGAQGTLAGGPAFPGGAQTLTLSGLDLSGGQRYLSYAAMVVLSNDFFVGSATPVDLSALAHGGTLKLYLGGNGQVFDAGTEINDFRSSVANGAFGIGGGQTAAGQGADERGVIHALSGANPYASFLGQELVPAGYDFGPLSLNGTPFAVLTISAVPEPSQAALLFGGLAMVGLVASRRRRSA